MKFKFEDNTDYRSFVKEMIKLCKKYNIVIHAFNEGFVGLSFAESKIIKDYTFDEFHFSSTKASLYGKKDIRIEL